jgi:MYXO-CTERM domain-containing protein
LTRLHARYGKDIAKDLVLEPAAPIVGGREVPASGGGLGQGALPGSDNRFQARYAIRHRWTGPIRCSEPRRGIWGGPPPEIAKQPGFQPIGTKPALDLAFAARDTVDLARAVTRDIPALGITAGSEGTAAPPPAPPELPAGSASAAPAKDKKKGCGCQSAEAGDLFGVVLGLGLLARRRRRR